MFWLLGFHALSSFVIYHILEFVLWENFWQEWNLYISLFGETLILAIRNSYWIQAGFLLTGLIWCPLTQLMTIIHLKHLTSAQGVVLCLCSAGLFLKWSISWLTSLPAEEQENEKYVRSQGNRTQSGMLCIVSQKGKEHHSKFAFTQVISEIKQEKYLGFIGIP